LRIAAFRILAFSRSKKPIFATSCEQMTSTPGSSLETILCTCLSCWKISSIGEKTPAITTADNPSARISAHLSTTCLSSTGASSDPSICKPPSTYPTYPLIIFARAGGKSENGGTSRKKLLERRMIATLFSLRTSRSIAALMKCVVPTVTEAMSEVESLERVRTALTASSMPWVTSGEVGVLKWARRPRFEVCCCDLSMATASVFVPERVALVME
jgi:hypothetical protein